MLNYLQAMAYSGPPAFARLALLVVVLGVFWHVQNRITKFDDGEELYVKNNYAYLLHRAALMTAFVVGSLPALARDYGDRPWQGLLWQLSELAWLFVALLVVRIIVDKVVLLRVNNLQELLKGNVALGVVEAGFYVGFGFVLNGSLSGASPTVSLGILSTVVFGVLGLLVMIVVFLFHELVTPWHLREKIREGNMTASLEVAGVLAAIGIVVREGVAGDFTGWASGLIAFSATALFGVVMLYLFRWLIDKAILHNCTLSSIQENNQVVASTLMASLFVLIAFPIALVIRTQL